MSLCDSALQQIIYGTWTSANNGTFTASGTIDFAYHAPFADTPWTTPSMVWEPRKGTELPTVTAQPLIPTIM